MSLPKTIVITTLGKCTADQLLHLTNDNIRTDGGGPKKRRRLTHLTASEKQLRRKMKNRVAAQTARDRKKALMEDLQEKVDQLQKQQELLLKENAQLRLEQAAYQQENTYLKSLTALSSSASPVMQPACVSGAKEPHESSALPCKTEPEYPRSAESAVSLLKEQIQGLPCVMTHIASCVLTFSLILCCICLKKSTLNWDNRAVGQKHNHRRPAQCITDKAEPAVVLATEKHAPAAPWWGPQQQMWTPSMK